MRVSAPRTYIQSGIPGAQLGCAPHLLRALTHHEAQDVDVSAGAQDGNLLARLEQRGGPKVATWLQDSAAGHSRLSSGA